MELIATRTVRIGRTEYKAGETFDVPEKEAKAWIAIRKAKLPDNKPKTVDLPVMSRASKVEPLTEHEPVNFTKRRYRRRDMAAGPTGPDASSE
jgi:hypothetical protein